MMAPEPRFDDALLAELAKLRDDDKLAFAEIGRRYGVSATRARFLYSRHARRNYQRAKPRPLLEQTKPDRRYRATKPTLLDVPEHDPNAFLSYCAVMLDAKNDAALARMMRSSPGQISKFRAGVTPISPSFLIRFHEQSGVPFVTIRERLRVSPEVPL